ncbi:MAG: acyltransferase [Bryobacterales bacterium]|nr:acyltransferase [Bryobacterales bacterium]MBV9396814.1 acyltransferase [Bryobacterales bacterium]
MDSRRIPSLDGLRAISIGLVLFGHLCGTANFFPRSAFAPLGDFANLGVRVFFVISGFLITYLMLDEIEATGTVSLKLFYLRRTLRIFPASYGFILFIFLASRLGGPTLARGDLFHAITYTVNYHLHASWVVGHLWSLSVEEQFYLLWPALIAFFSLRYATLFAVNALWIAPISRFVIATFLPAYRWGVAWWFPTIMDPIATGCLLAIFRKRLEANGVYMAVLRSRWFVLIPCCAFLANMRPDGRRLSMLLLQPFINVAIAVTIHRVVLFDKTMLGRFLNLRPLAFVGVLSYSLYLWQQPFLNRSSQAVVCAFPWNLMIAGVAAAASYAFIERPALAIRKKLEQRVRQRYSLKSRIPLFDCAATVRVGEEQPSGAKRQ